VKERLGTRAVPMVVFARGSHYAIEGLNVSDYDGISLDWTIHPRLARTKTSKVLQGNADPCLLYASKNTIQQRVKGMLEAFGPREKYVANLGHGMYPGKLFFPFLKNFIKRNFY
jgi:uroporphyrinogen decarboxylase